ncbi:MarR family winged helix-turn-helix transcriptional regulator [Humibacillus xanthopallidus]|uniref:DNA-binding MarR family transcriptional regulator n=1 Tax=Humibacillus xanthopallidus TaxID=412689 RepID=A0A543HGC5_9MICO|nr:MarR family transcriptional regulator [Humibacillus xanthopallidus]TQM57395.1 DNA-binding MarR family transcriptional regulator [Humibacillus xanthopallidus]
MRPADDPPVDATSPDETSLDELLMGAARALRRTWAGGLGPDLSPHDARALRVIGHHGPTRLGVVADHLRIAPRSATDVVDRLEARGLVERAPDPADRRAMTVSLTDVGTAVLADVDKARREGAAEFFGVLSEDERASLAGILGRLDPRA